MTRREGVYNDIVQVVDQIPGSNWISNLARFFSERPFWTPRASCCLVHRVLFDQDQMQHLCLHFIVSTCQRDKVPSSTTFLAIIFNSGSHFLTAATQGAWIGWQNPFILIRWADDDIIFHTPEAVGCWARLTSSSRWPWVESQAMQLLRYMTFLFQPVRFAPDWCSGCG